MGENKHFKKYILIGEDEYSRFKKKTGMENNPVSDLSLSPELVEAEKERKKMRENLLNPNLSTEEKLLYHSQLARKFQRDLEELRRPQIEMQEQMKQISQLAEKMNGAEEGENDSKNVTPSLSKSKKRVKTGREKKISTKKLLETFFRQMKDKKTGLEEELKEASGTISKLIPPTRPSKVESVPLKRLTSPSPTRGAITRTRAREKKKQKTAASASPLLGRWKV